MQFVYISDVKCSITPELAFSYSIPPVRHSVDCIWDKRIDSSAIFLCTVDERYARSLDCWTEGYRHSLGTSGSRFDKHKDVPVCLWIQYFVLVKMSICQGILRQSSYRRCLPQTPQCHRRTFALSRLPSTCVATRGWPVSCLLNLAFLYTRGQNGRAFMRDKVRKTSSRHRPIPSFQHHLLFRFAVWKRRILLAVYMSTAQKKAPNKRSTIINNAFDAGVASLGRLTCLRPK